MRGGDIKRVEKWKKFRDIVNEYNNGVMWHETCGWEEKKVY